MIEQDIVEFEEELDEVARGFLAAVVNAEADQVVDEEEVIGFCDESPAKPSPMMQMANRAALAFRSPSDSLVSPVSGALRKGRGAPLSFTAQRRLEMKSQPQKIVEQQEAEPAGEIMAQEQSIPSLCNELRTASNEDHEEDVSNDDGASEEMPKKVQRLELTHANMPPLPTAVATRPRSNADADLFGPPAASPVAMAVAQPSLVQQQAAAPVAVLPVVQAAASVWVSPLAKRFSATAADVRAADAGVECLDDVAEATRNSRNFWLQKEREEKRSQLL